MEYYKEFINDYPCLIPDIFKAVCSDVPVKFAFAKREVTSSDTSDSYLSLMNVDKELFDGKIVLDICSGLSNIDYIAEKSKKVIRLDIDEHYSDKKSLDTLLGYSKYPEKYVFLNASADRIPLVADSVDVITECWGFFYYMPSILGVGRDSAHVLSRKIENMNQQHLDRVYSGVKMFLGSLAERVRVLKSDGVAISDYDFYIDNGPYELFVVPTLELWKNSGLLSSTEKVRQVSCFDPRYSKLVYLNMRKK